MPELPEVEVTRLGVAEIITGAVITNTRIGKPLRWPLNCVPQNLVGQTIHRVRRRAKYLLLDLDDGLLLIHLGMSGRLCVCENDTPESKHDHFDIITSKGTLRLHDPRRFGAVVWSASETSGMGHKLLSHLGAEPLSDEFTTDDFANKLKKRHASIKHVLLSGDLVVGVGNIYASESLFLARINPKKAANKISKKRVNDLTCAIKTILSQAIEYGGSTLKDFRSAQGEHGLFQNHAKVYGRAGEPCAVCEQPIKVIQQGQRSTYFCANCQK